MLSNNRVIIAAAGSGKTTLLIREAVSKPDRAIAIVTYTDNNEQELKKKFYEHVGHIPPNVTIMTWFSFLLAECVRPYQNYVYSEHRIDSINFVEGKSAPYINRSDVKNYYFSDERLIYTDKISAFACRCEEVSGGLVTQRLAQIYDEIYIDEVQDLAGYDLELIERFLNTSITMLLVGDIRQGTYVTNNSAKNSGQRGKDIILRFEKWQKRIYVQLNTSRTVIAAIKAFAILPITSTQICRRQHPATPQLQGTMAFSFCLRFWLKNM